VRPAGLDGKTTPAAPFAAYENAKVDPDLLAKNLQAIKPYMARHGYQLSCEDLSNVAKVYTVFSRGGAGINYAFANPTPAVGPPSEATYSRLMNTSDITGRNSSFLATEENYRTCNAAEEPDRSVSGRFRWTSRDPQRWPLPHRAQNNGVCVLRLQSRNLSR
jgi:hypothetical protein